MTTTRKLIASIAATAAVASVLLVAAPAPGAQVAVRERFFGAENVDDVTGDVVADKVILSWFGVTNFAAAIGGHVVLLDAWVPRGEYSGYVPTSPEELASLEPEAIILGHGHFDHAADAAEIATLSGAPIVGTPEQCDQAREQASVTLACVEVVPRGAAPGATGDVAVLSGVGMRVVKHVHSAGRMPDTSDPHTPAAPPPSFDAILQHPPSPDEAVELASHLGDAEAGTLLWRFSVGAFSMVWHDSTGPLKEDAPAVLTLLESLRPVDVQVGAIMGFNQISNGMRDQRHYIERLQPRVFMPAHHDNWAPPVSTRAEEYRPIITSEINRIPAETRPALLFIADPGDYVKPIVFEIDDPAWS